jgi:hypothetical protein
MRISNLVRNAFGDQRVPRITIVYVAVVAVLVAVLLAQNTGGRPAANTLTMPDLPEMVARVEIEDARGALTLLQGDEHWLVGTSGTDYDELFPARKDAVMRLLDRLRELTRLEVVTERGSDREYGFVEAARRTVRIEGSAGESFLLELGYTAASGEAIYARLQGESTVVRLPRALHNAVSTDPEDYRDMVVARIPEDQIRRIEIVGGVPGGLQVERVDATETAEAPPAGAASAGAASAGAASAGAGDAAATESPQDRRETPEYRWEVTGDTRSQLAAEIRPERVQDLLRELASLAAMGFPDEATLPPLEPFVTLRVETIRGPTHTIEIAPPDDERRLLAASTTSPYAFYLPEWRVRRLLLGIEAYLAPYMEATPQF